MNRFIKSSLNERGVTLAEVMVVVGMLAISGAAFFQMIGYQNRVAKFARAQQGRDVTVSTLRNLLSNPGVLYWAAAAPGNPNSEFSKCVLGSTTAACEKGRDYPLKVFFPNTQTVASGSALPTAAPVFYDHLNAEPCDASNAGSLSSSSVDGCPLAVTTYFRARCPLDQNSCKQAQLVQIVVDIRNRAKGQASSGEDAAMNSLREVHDEIVIETAQIALYKSQDGSVPGVNDGCPPGEIALGFDGLGNLFCQRLEYACPTGYYTVGIDRYFRPVANLATGMGEFASPTEVKCAPLDCGGRVMISMFNSNGQLQPECLDTNRTCNLSDATVMTSLEADGNPRCAFLDSCDEVNEDGTQMSKLNFTRGFKEYNGKFSGTAGSEVGVVKAYCEPYGCGRMQYMRQILRDGQCKPCLASDGVPCPP